MPLHSLGLLWTFSLLFLSSSSLYFEKASHITQVGLELTVYSRSGEFLTLLSHLTSQVLELEVCTANPG